MSKESIIAEKALELGFADAGFTDARPFETQREILAERSSEYGWVNAMGLDLVAGTDPATVLPGAKSILVVLDAYVSTSYPERLTRHFGRCYLDDDRVTKDGLTVRIKALRSFLEGMGMRVKVPFNLPHRVAAARSGLGSFGKNCLFYAKRAVLGSSWVLPITLVVDAELEPAEPDYSIACPAWCKNACIASCPTGALRSPRTIDPRRCISYLTYFGEGPTPRELREPMGLWVYGCDRCQLVCPRNAAWLARDLPPNERVAAKADDFALSSLLHMDRETYLERVWPHMFYMSPDDLWRWKMNAARAMGNTQDEAYIPDLVRAYEENSDERVLVMIAWALGRIGGRKSREALERFLGRARGETAGEIRLALDIA